MQIRCVQLKLLYTLVINGKPLFYMYKSKEKDDVFLIRISKDEAFYLRDNKLQKYVVMTSRQHKAHGKRYFAVDNEKVRQKLAELAQNQVKTTFDGR